MFSAAVKVYSFHNQITSVRVAIAKMMSEVVEKKAPQNQPKEEVKETLP